MLLFHLHAAYKRMDGDHIMVVQPSQLARRKHCLQKLREIRCKCNFQVLNWFVLMIFQHLC